MLEGEAWEGWEATLRRVIIIFVFFGIAVTLAVLGPGIYQCVTRTGTCGQQVLNCVTTALTPNVQAALLTIGLGGAIAWWYQRANKIMEFRFNTFEKAMSVYAKLSDAAWGYFNHQVLIRRSRREGIPPERMAVLEREVPRLEAALEASLMSAHTVLAVNGILFSRRTLDRWGAMIRHFEWVAGDDLWAMEEHIFIAGEERLAFIRAVARTLRLQMVEPTPGAIAEMEAARAQLHANLQSLQPRSEQPDGGSGGNYG